MAGAKPLMTYTFEHSPEHKELLKNCIEHFTSDGWEWYVDFYVNWMASPWKLEVYKEKLAKPIRDFLFERSL